jgi:hypothetical protein
MPQKSIECKTSHKHLASIDHNSIYLWCKRCNTTHKIPKEEILKYWGISQEQVIPVTIR